MKIYHYHGETGEFLGEGLADKSPLEEDVWLIPANATTSEPPEVQGNKIRIFRNESWEYIDRTFAEKPQATDAEKLQQIRNTRNYLLNEIDVIVCNAQRWSEMTDEQKFNWTIYKQVLRDFTATVDLNNVVWPEIPIL